jgi:hypothetical protein
MRNKLGLTLIGCIAVFAMSAAVQADSVTYDFNTAGDLDLYFTRVISGGANPQPVYSETATGGINDTRNILVNAFSNMEARYEKEAFPVALNTWTQTLLFQAKTRTSTSATATPILAIGVANGNTDLPKYWDSGSLPQISIGIAPRNSTGWRLQLYSNDGTTYYTSDTGINSTFEVGNWYALVCTYTEQLDGTYKLDASWNLANAAGVIGGARQSLSWTATGSEWLSADPTTAHAFIYSYLNANVRGIDRFDNFTTPTPEPATAVLLSLGAIGALCRRRR